MAKKMAYTNPDNQTVYPDCTWLFIFIAADATSPTGRVAFLPYKDVETAAKMLKFILGLPGAQRIGPVGPEKSYSLTADQFRTFGLAVKGPDAMLNMLADDAYTLAVNTLDQTSTATVANKALAGGVATLTTAAAHGLLAGDAVTVSGVGAPFDGSFAITSVPTATTLTYTAVHEDVPSAAAGGTVANSKSFFATAVDVDLLALYPPG